MIAGVGVLIFSVNRSRIGVGFYNFGVGLESESQKRDSGHLCNKLKRHLETRHSRLVDKQQSFFEREEQKLKGQRLDASTNTVVMHLQQATLPSYLVAWRIVRANKAHIIGEELVKPAALDMVRTVYGYEFAKKIEGVPLSNDTVKNRIKSMSCDIKDQVIETIKKSGQFSLQLDESTDVSDDAQLLTYVRYQGPAQMEEEFLFCKPLQTTTAGEDIFVMVDLFFKQQGLLWKQCYRVCCDGAPAMLGSRQGFTARVKQENPSALIVHCFLHRENLASKKLSHEFQKIMQEVIQIVNFIKSRAFNSRLFAQMCPDFGSDHIHLL